MVEVESTEKEAQPLAGGLADKVGTTFDMIRPVLVKTCRPIIGAWKEINQEMHVEEAEVELGLSFEGTGDVFVAKSTAGANLAVKLVLKPERASGGKSAG